MISYVMLVLIKIVDNIILTAKSIATYKEKRIISSILVIVSQLIFYLIIDQVISDNTMLTIVIVSVSSGVGNYIAFLINDKFKQDDKWSMVLTTSDVEEMKRLCSYLVAHNIKYIANDGYNRKGEHTINVMAFSKTKGESRLIEQYLQSAECKYMKEIIK